MKRISIVFLVLLLAPITFAQPAKELTARSAYTEGKLIDAMKSIDQAIQHDKTKGSAKAWKLRGDIYGAILTSTDVDSGVDRPVIYQRIAESYKKAMNLDGRGLDTKSIKNNAQLYGNMALNDGVTEFNGKTYSKAKTMFLTAIDLNAAVNLTDSLATYNVALATERMDDFTTAAKYYGKCIEMGYRTETMYAFQAFAYKQLGDAANYEKTLKEGIEKFPSSISLVTSMLNVKLINGDFEGAVGDLKLLISNDPSNPVMHFSLGTVMDNLGRLEEAISYYTDAISLDASYFDPKYNLGALYFNQGVEVNNKANEIEDKVMYDKKRKEADLLFFNAQTHLEKAHELKPEDLNTLNSLKQCYIRTDDQEGYGRIDAIIKKLGL